jgi:hypothetical protein
MFPIVTALAAILALVLSFLIWKRRQRPNDSSDGMTVKTCDDDLSVTGDDDSDDDRSVASTNELDSDATSNV